MSKITVSFLRDALLQYDKEEISISRFAELLNEKATEDPTYDIAILKEANETLRSCHEVVIREGKNTNWDALRQPIQKCLMDQHKILFKNVS